MYNGIGLQTARGSGTNGYVQKNAAFVKKAREKVDYKSELELRRADQHLFKEPNKEILEHERKRAIELKCAEMQVLMEDQGYAEDEIDKKVANLRKFLNQQEADEASNSAGSGAGKESQRPPKKPLFAGSSAPVTKDAETGRVVAKGTHELNSARQQQTETMREALGIGKDYVPGQAMKRSREEKDKEKEKDKDKDKDKDVADDSSASSESDSDAEKERLRKKKAKKEKRKEEKRERKREKKEKKRERREKKEKKRRRREMEKAGGEEEKT